MRAEDWQWPSSFLDGFRQDLKQVHTMAGPFDAVFFTGDLAYSGQRAEYVNCSRFIGQLVALLDDLGTKPKPAIFFVPGNHDMLRSPDTMSLAGLPASAWEPGQIDEAYLRRVLWNALEPFDACAHGWRYASVNWGATIGDFSGDVDKNGYAVGVLGINTAVNQGGANENPEWVPFDRRRVEDVLKASVERWADKRRLRFLLTHHPPQDFQYLHWDRSFPTGKSGFQIHFCSRPRKTEPQSVLSGRGLLVVEAPDFAPQSGGEIGYSAGAVDLENPAFASIWNRSYSRHTNTWQPTGGSVVVTVSALPVGKPAKTLKPLRESIYIESLSLRGFRCFDQIKLPLNRPSRLEGRWTCIAGINGAGKSSILQALGVVLLGDRLAADLQSGRLSRMRRLVGSERQVAEIGVALRAAATNRPINLQVEISDSGIASSGGLPVAPPSPAPSWDEIRRYVIAGYGATRNLSSTIERGIDELGPDVRRMITLFNPLSQLSAADVLLTQQPEDGPLIPLLQNVLTQIFGRELRIEASSEGVRFTVGGEDRVEAIDLPDGFRAAAAWMADLCAIWCEKAPELAANGDPADIQAIVLLDEIDLHLHPSLQRELVPRLRKTFPKVQWIVTTHSPLVLANFDKNEIIALDRDVEGGVRELDRQILGFTSDEVYSWLMGTQPTGAALEEEIRQSDGGVGRSAEELASLMQESPGTNEAEAQKQVSEFKEILKSLKR